MLRSTAQVCIVLARGLPKRIPAEFRKPIDDGRLIFVSPFEVRIKRATAESAMARNLLIATLAEKMFVAYAAAGSKTDTLCRSISKLNKPCLTFSSPHTENLIKMGFNVFAG